MMRAHLAAATLFAASIIAACGNGTVTTSGPATAPGTSSTPTSAGASPAATASPAETSGASGTTVRNPAQGVEVTLPAGWIAVTPELARDSAAIAELKASAGADARAVDDLLANLAQHPEYWMVGTNVSNRNVVTGSLVTNTGDLAAWTTAQEAALKTAYGTVETRPLTSPRPGTAFTFTAGQFTTRLYGLARPGGMAILTFAAPATDGAPSDWDEIVSTFQDAGTS
jgi:hypothetical protein